MIYYEVKNTKGRDVASNIELYPGLQDLAGRDEENFSTERMRHVFRRTETGSVRLVITEDTDLRKSNKMIRRIVEVFADLIPEFGEQERKHRQYFDVIINRFAHNLVKFQVKLKGSLIRLASDVARERNPTYQDFVSDVERRITGNTASAAKDIAEFAHRVADLDAQVEGLRVISGFAERTAPSLVNCNVLKALIRLRHPFIQEFETKNIFVDIQIRHEESDQYKIRLDPQLFGVVMWQFFDNAIKYSCPGNPIVFTADLRANPQTLTCTMTSLQIADDETEKIFIEKYKGRSAKDFLGDGLGMFMVRRALRLMGADVSVSPDNSSPVSVGGHQFCKNTFTLYFRPQAQLTRSQS